MAIVPIRRLETPFPMGFYWVFLKEGYFKVTCCRDSKAIIDWVIDSSNLQVLHLERWKEEYMSKKNGSFFFIFLTSIMTLSMQVIGYIQ